MLQILHVLVTYAALVMAKTPPVTALMPPNVTGPHAATAPKTTEPSQNTAEPSERPWVSIITNVNVNVSVSKSVNVDVSTGVKLLSSGQTAEDANKNATTKKKNK